MYEAELKHSRERLLAEISDDAARTEHYTGRASFANDVMTAIGQLSREHFIPEHMQNRAYENQPLPIGRGQTISQPFIVALMTELLDLQPTNRVLEIGTGSGYQTAILAELTAEVFTIELIAELQEAARERLLAINHTTIEYRVGNGWTGWPEEAPFDCIIVTAAAIKLPMALSTQLRPGGRMILPIGRQNETQFLTRLTRDKDGYLREKRLLPVSFVPLVDGSTDNT